MRFFHKSTNIQHRIHWFKEVHNITFIDSKRFTVSRSTIWPRPSRFMFKNIISFQWFEASIHEFKLHQITIKINGDESQRHRKIEFKRIEARRQIYLFWRGGKIGKSYTPLLNLHLPLFNSCSCVTLLFASFREFGAYMNFMKRNDLCCVVLVCYVYSRVSDALQELWGTRILVFEEANSWSYEERGFWWCWEEDECGSRNEEFLLKSIFRNYESREWIFNYIASNSVIISIPSQILLELVWSLVKSLLWLIEKWLELVETVRRMKC